jgi:hypothetical protein
MRLSASRSDRRLVWPVVGCFIAIFEPVVKASDLVEVSPLTNRVLMLKFDDGYVRYHGYHETSNQDAAVNSPLDTDSAGRPSSYAVSAPDDPDYAEAVQPEKVGRKSKGKDFSRRCQWNGSQCVNDIVFEHHVYLRLPFPLKKNVTYTLTLKDLARNLNQTSFQFDESRIRSEAVHVNQLGYTPMAGEKYGYVSHWMGDLGGLSLDDYAGARFDLIDLNTHQSVCRGALRSRYSRTQRETGQSGDTPNANFSNADVWECDFSDFKVPGSYVLAVEGVGCSFPFRVAGDVYRQAFRLTCRNLYHQRAGIALDEPYTRWRRPADHNPTVDGTKIKYTTVRYMDQTTENGDKNEVYSGVKGDLPNTYGWYHDAGDWDGYPSHSAVPKHLLTVYELAPENFVDGELNIPESGNRIPDILDESAWLVDYYQRNVGPTGGIFGSRIHPDFAGGEADGIPSWEDRREWVAYAEEPAASFDFAGMAAQSAYNLRIAARRVVDATPARTRRSRRPPPVSPLEAKINSLISSAESAYDWAQSNLRAGDPAKVRDVRMYAAAWLYKFTGNPTYQAQFAVDNQVTSANISAFDSQRWGVWAYATIPDGTPGLNAALKADLIAAAKKFADSDNLYAVVRRSYRQGGNFWMPLLIGQATTPWVMPSIVAYELSGEPRYLNCVHTTSDYMLGGNPLNMVWVSGLGQRFPTQLLHLDSWYDGIDQMVPGIVPYGPHRGDNNGWNGPWDADYARERAVYPPVSEWPGHELYFENRYCPITNEFTIHQNIAPAAAVYGYLAGAAAVHTSGR